MCACAQKAKANSYEYFGIENYGECWSGMTAKSAKYSVHGPSGNCHMVKENECAFEACDEQRNKFRLCVGASVSMYVYKIKQKRKRILYFNIAYNYFYLFLFCGERYSPRVDPRRGHFSPLALFCFSLDELRKRGTAVSLRKAALLKHIVVKLLEILSKPKILWNKFVFGWDRLPAVVRATSPRSNEDRTSCRLSRYNFHHPGMECIHFR